MKMLFWGLFCVFFAICQVLGQDSEERPKGYVDEIKANDKKIDFFRTGSGGDQVSFDYYKLVISKIKGKFDPKNLSCNIVITAELAPPKSLGKTTFRSAWLKIDIKGKRQLETIPLPVPKSEEEIASIPDKQEQKIYKELREEQIQKSLDQILTSMQCPQEIK